MKRFIVKIDGEAHHAIARSAGELHDATMAAHPDARSVVVLCVRGCP